jgi:hypothetical protein
VGSSSSRCSLAPCRCQRDAHASRGGAAVRKGEGAAHLPLLWHRG